MGGGGGGGGARFRILRGAGGQIPSRHMTSFRRHVPTGFLINQCQIITFLILKYDIIENSSIELKEIKLHSLLFYPLTWYICDFFLFHIEIEGKGWWIIGGGGGAKSMLAPSRIIGGPCPPTPWPPSLPTLMTL